MTRTIGFERVTVLATSIDLASWRFGTNTTAGFRLSQASVTPRAAVCASVTSSRDDRNGQKGSHFGVNTPIESWYCAMLSRMDEITQTDSMVVCCSIVFFIIDPEKD